MTKSKLWGGRFSKKTHALVEDFTRSLHFDKKLAAYDCFGSLAHIEVLKDAGLLTAPEHRKLKKGLQKILKNVDKVIGSPDMAFEDIHSYIQHLLEKDPAVGAAALKLHTCRSRNDQVVFDTKFYCKFYLLDTGLAVEKLNIALLNLAKKNSDLLIPGYTHLQHAIPIRLVQHLLAYSEMLTRDTNRLKNVEVRINLTLGAGALAGTFIQSSKYNLGVTDFVKRQLVKDTPDGLKILPSGNSIDSVSDRDFVIEILSALAILGMHLSRLAEDMILWSSKEFDFIEIDDAFCTGSSLMPQKKNPDVLELVRGLTGRFYGNLVNVLVMMKGLPLSYNRDMQHDKEPLFDSFEQAKKALAVLAELFKNVTFKTDNIKKQLADESLYATDLADYLVQKGVPFKTAHTAIGKLMAYKDKTGRNLKDMSDDELHHICPLLNTKVIKARLNPKASVTAKKSVRRQR